MKEENIFIFTDGSSRGNPGPGGFGAIIFDKKNIYEIGGNEEKTTNNRMEIQGAINSLSFIDEKIEEKKKIFLFSDSKYLILSVNKWRYNWEKNGWIKKDETEVQNKDLWINLFALIDKLKPNLDYVKGHSGMPINERVDEIATSFADKKDIELYLGNIKNYFLKNKIYEFLKKGLIYNEKSDQKYYYISIIQNKIKKYDTWEDCEKEVKGIKGAKWKKVKDGKEEKIFIKKCIDDK